MQSIILIGPMGAGKSTISRLLAERLGVPLVSLDTVRHEYRKDFPHIDPDREQYLRAHDYEGLLTYWEPFSAYTVERALMENSGPTVFDFGAIHSVYDDPLLFARIAARLAPYPSVFLLLPTPDAEANVSLLFERGVPPTMDRNSEIAAMWRRVIRRFVQSPCNGQLAKCTLYNQNLAPDITVEAIIAFL